MQKLNEEDFNIIKFLLCKFNEGNIEDYEVKLFSEGTSSKVILLNNKYIIKQNSEEIIKAELIFYKNNNDPLFQKLLYYDDKNYKYIVYEYIEGETLSELSNINITHLINTLIKVVNSYKKTNIEYYGYVYDPNKTWIDFLKKEIIDCQPSYKYIKNFNIENECNILSKYQYVQIQLF